MLLAKAIYMGACVAQAPDPLTDWANVQRLKTGTELIVVQQAAQNCLLDHADEFAIVCTSRLETRAVGVTLYRRIERGTIGTVLMRRTPAEAVLRKERYKLGALAGGELGAVLGFLIGRKNGDAFRGSVAGGLAGAGAGLAIAAVVQNRHDQGAVVIYQAP